MRCFLILALAMVAACSKASGGTSGTGGGSSTGSASSGGVTGSSSSGSTTGGSSGGATTGGSGSGTTTGGTTTGTPPYQGYDAGPHPEPPIDVGCSARTPFMLDAGICVACRWDSDCPPNRYCGLLDVDVAYLCYPCRPDPDAGSVGCAPGEVCASPNFFPYCIADCRTAGVDCTPGYCEPDAGVCVKNGCRDNADCRGFAADGDAGGICYLPLNPPVCVGCFADGGECAGGQLCDLTGNCVPNCLDGGTNCPTGSYCASTGLCTTGCQMDGDCGGAYPYCQLNLTPPSCAPCLQSSDCPGWQPRCLTAPGCSLCLNQCGQCAGNSDCAPGQHCGAQGCSCNSNADCAPNPMQPFCIGLNDGGSDQGACACRTSADCGANSVCETRSPYLVTAYDSLLGEYTFGGVCIPSCVGADPGYCAAAVGRGQASVLALDNATCNPATGYCVPCAQDSDCSISSSQPVTAPSCIPFPGGNFTSNDGSPPLPTGGGQCGCADNLSCSDGFTCYGPSSPGTCQAPCTYVDGIDSCEPHRFIASRYGPYCNTFTGACQECLDDYDCSGTVTGSTSSSAGICGSQGKCVQCVSAGDCPADLPGCFNGECGLCAGDSDCPADAGLTCAPYHSGGILRCMAPCVPADDAGMGSVSDAGPSCPTAQPFCTSSATSSPGQGWCSECRYGAADCAYFCCGTYCSAGFSICPY